MVKPSGTTLYPEDAAILDEIEAALASGRHGSRTDAIRPFLPRIEGASDEAKTKRMIRGLQRRERERKNPGGEDLRELAKALRGRSPDEKADLIADVTLRTKRAIANTHRAYMRLRERGVEPDGDTMRMLLLAELGEPDPPKKGGGGPDGQ